MVEAGRLRQRKPSQDSVLSRASNSSNGLDKSEVNRLLRGPAEKVVHRAQDSLFSSSSGWTNYRGFFNLAMLLLIVSNGRVALENIIKYGILVSPLTWISFFLTDLSLWNWPNMALLVGSNITILIVFFTEKTLQKGYLGEYFAGVFYPFLIVTHLTIPAVITLYVKGNPLYSVATLGIFVVEALKMVSYVHVNYWGRSARREQSTNKQKLTTDEIKDMYVMASLYPSNLTITNLYYFMCAPTLCYEVRFPKTVRRRKSFVIKRFVELVFLTFLIAALIQQWIIPTVRNSMAPLSEMEVTKVIERLLKLAIPNIFIWLIFFYTLFHSALNFLAEILLFADREFYRDFWNSETISYFWKTWNIPVHRWAVRHVYAPMMRHNYSKKSAMIVVFFISAFFHEYLVSVPLAMFRLWAYYGMMAQIPLSFLTDYIIKGGRAGNVVVWLSLIVGQPLAILMYVHDWYLMHYPGSIPTPDS